MPGETAPKMRINTEIFKAYDIRGLYPGEINEEVARLIGRGFVTYLGASKIGVSRDMRVSSPGLAAAFIEGARQQGADVVDYGMLGTDMLYFAVVNDGLQGGAQITASHNPKQYNGIKMVRSGAQPLSGDAGLAEIRDMIVNDTLPPAAATPGSVSPRNIIFEYVEKVMSFIDPSAIKPFTVVLDAGSGMAGLVAPLLFDQLPCKTTKLCFDIDGTFPNHEANPLIEENRRDITEEVMRQHADAGIAWDGDADRCFFIDDTGEFVPGDLITALIARTMLERHPGATIIYDLRASWAVRDTVAAAGGTALENRVGHAFMKARLRKEEAVFAGEVSGHYYFKDFYYCDTGIVPALVMLELISRSGQKLSQLLAPFRERYHISGEINSTVADVPLKLQELKDRFGPSAERVSHMDGISFEYPDWHFNVRPSNTEPLLRLNLEALSAETMERRRDEVLALITS